MPNIIDNRGAVNPFTNPDQIRQVVLAAAESALGVQYRWGGNSLTTGVDCSGLMQQAFLAAGIRLPRVSSSQATVGRPVTSIDDAEPGDLLTWDTGSRNVGADHVAMYLGGGLMLEAYRAGQPVRVTQVRAGAKINRVIGEVSPGAAPTAVKLGPNKDRRYTTAAATGVKAQAQVPAAAVTGTPQGGLGDDLAPNASDADVEAYIRKHYSDVAGYLNNAEIKKILFESARAGEDDIEVLARLRQTNYWRSQGPASRQFDLLRTQDPNEAERRLNNQRNDMRSLLAQQGVKLDDAELGKSAEQAIRGAWDEGDINRWIASELRDHRTEGALPTGAASLDTDRLEVIASSYGIRVPRSALEEWSLRILDGSATQDTFMSEVKKLATDRWSYNEDIVKRIGEGISPKALFAPHVEEIASQLEISPDQVDVFNDPTWQKVTDFFDPATNQRRSMTIGEAGQMARDRDEYTKTTAYRKTKSNAALELAQFFGEVA